MKITATLSLRKRLCAGLMIVFLLSISTGILLFWDSGYSSNLAETSSDTGKTVPDVRQIRSGPRQAILWMLMILLPSVSGWLLWEVRTLFVRLNSLSQSTNKMVEGNFDGSLPTGPRDELGAMGDAVNDLAANFQEFLLLSWNHTSSCIHTLDDILNQSAVSGDVSEKMPDIRNNLESIRSVIQEFEFYEVRINSGKLTATEALKDAGRNP